MGVSSNADKMVEKALLIGFCGALFGDKWSSSILFQVWLEKMTLIKLSLVTWKRGNKLWLTHVLRCKVMIIKQL
ncbi:hypothetical protein CKAN_00883600 [Cinnamomum micranthum f. kanehirae]|uniref:Uncharacterized protein n=1 Tax=Cinnamomum micranthum f. kanehirae TaxID=337451 RepID=A0A3S3N3P5_9MAGN|nr:hypothetical protein CKAN_00883600 [Cinnamomum micranthum f. kanehirae]